MGIAGILKAMGRYTWTILLLVAALAAAFAAWRFWLRDDTSLAGCRDRLPQPVIVAFGDSLVAGQGATTAGGFVSMLTAQSGVPIRNFGKGGDTTAAAQARIDSALAAKPDIALILLGGNDALRRIPYATTEANLDSVIERFQNAGVEVILLGVMGDLFNDPYPDMFERLAERHEVALVPNVLAGLLGRNELMSDAIHPNEEGYTRIAARVLLVLEEACAD